MLCCLISTAYEIKSAMAEKYLPTYHGILREIAKGSTGPCRRDQGCRKRRRSLRLGICEPDDGCIRVCRIAGIDDPGGSADGFSGVLVSDFYAAYDSVPCAQQKCLIHLMRDINEDLHKNPFDDDLKEIARRFGALLREIVETIDSYGLKARNLGKHRKSA